MNWFQQQYHRRFSRASAIRIGGFGDEFCVARKVNGKFYYLRRDGWRRCCGPKGIYDEETASLLAKAYKTGYADANANPTRS